jgi:hypothetical protein
LNFQKRLNQQMLALNYFFSSGVNINFVDLNDFEKFNFFKKKNIGFWVKIPSCGLKKFDTNFCEKSR